MDNEKEKSQVFKYDLSSYEETFAIPKLVFKIVGIRLMVNESKFRRLCWNVLYWTEFFNIFMATMLELINMVQTAAEGSLMDLFQMLPCVGYMLLAMVKSYKVVYYRPVCENVVNELRKMWPQREVSEEEHLVLNNALKRLKYISKGYYWCNIALNTIFTSPPFINIVKRLTGKDVPLILSFLYWLPFDPFTNGIYHVLLVLQTWHCIITLGFMLSSDLLFFVFMSHITTQLDLLAIRVRRIFRVPHDGQVVASHSLAKSIVHEQQNENSVDEESRYDVALTEIITRHRILIRLSADVEDMFTFSLLLNFLNSSIIICFCGFCIVFVEQWTEMIYKLFLLTATVQIWFLCWYGQRLLDASTGVSEALYNSGWYISSKRIKQSILIMIHRTQKELCLTTYGFTIISLATYSTIIKTSWSYFTLLINMYNK